MMAGSAGGAVPVTSYLLLPPLPSSLFRAALSPPAISALYKARNPQAVMMEEFVETRASCMSTAVARITCGLQYEKCRHGHDRRQNCPKCSCPGESAFVDSAAHRSARQLFKEAQIDRDGFEQRIAGGLDPCFAVYAHAQAIVQATKALRP